MTYSICETTAAITLHAREVGEEGLHFGGGLHNLFGVTALCGAKVSWDTHITFQATAVRCHDCKKALEAK